MSLHLNLGLGDGVLLTRLFFFLFACWPLLSSIFIYLISQLTIKKKLLYFVCSIASGYALSILLPAAVILSFIIIGKSAEEATLFSFLTMPFLLVCPLIVSKLFSRRFSGEVRGHDT